MANWVNIIGKIFDNSSSAVTHTNTTMAAKDPTASTEDKATSTINSIADLAGNTPFTALAVNAPAGLYNAGLVFDDWKNDREIQSSDIINVSSNAIMSIAGAGALATAATVGTAAAAPVFITGAAIAGGVSLIGSAIDNKDNYLERFADGAEQAGNNINNALNKTTNKVQDYANSVADGAEQIGNNINNAFEKAVETVQDYVNRAKDGAEQMSNNIRNNVQNHIDRTQDGAVQAGNDIHNALDKAVEAVQNHANQMQNGAAQAGDDIQNAWNDYLNRAKDGLEQMSNDFRNYLEKMKESLEKATQNPEENPEESASSKDGADANNPNNPSNEQDHSGSENTIPTNGENVCKNPNPAAASAGGFGKGFGKGGSYDPFNPYTPYYDPLLISLNGNSKSDIYVNSYDDNSHTTMLDLNGDGIANKVSWIGKNTGILFLDENNNNQMDGFQELLSDGKILENGETSKNGFDYALNVLDTDSNKVLNADDEKFNQIKVLSFNEDNEEQIHTLTGLDIQSLNLNYANVALSAQHSFNNVHGENLVLQESTYTKTNGTQGKMVDVNFSYDSIHTQYLEELPPENTANLQGYGYLRDLNQAASLSEDLHHQLNEYSQLSTKDEQLNHLDSLLKSWAETSPYYSNEPIDIQSKTFYRNEEFFQNNKDVPRITANQANLMQNGLKNLDEQLDNEQLTSFNQEETQDKLHILQSFYGINHHTIYLNKPDELEKIIDNIDNDYAALKEDTYQHLLFQTRLKPYLSVCSLFYLNNKNSKSRLI